MAFLVFLLSLILIAVGLVSGYASLDLLPTSPGLVYAFAAVVAVVGGILVFALGLVVVRLGGLTRAVREQTTAAAAFAAAQAPLAEEAAGPPLEVDEAHPTEPETAAEDDALAAGDPEGEAGSADAERESRAPEESEAGEAEEPINENRAGRLPTLPDIEQAIEKPEAPPTLIGRYSSGGAQYMIFSDGSIEAETDEGEFKFASMGDFKKFLIERGAAGKT